MNIVIIILTTFILTACVGKQTVKLRTLETQEKPLIYKNEKL